MARKAGAPIDTDMRAIIDWINEGLVSVRQSQAALARHIGIPASRMSEVMHGKRFLKAVELQRASVFMNSPIPRAAAPHHISVVREVFVVGDIGLDWTSGGVDDYRQRRTVGTISTDAYPASQQMGFDVSHAIPAVDIMNGDIVIGVAIDAVAALKVGQLVVVERRMGKLRNYAIGRVTIPKTRTYVMLSPAHPDRHTSEIVAAVIATYRPR